MANLRKTYDELNRIYAPLKEKTVRIINTLKKLGADVEWGWYAGHSIDRRGELIYEEFPIPVITLKDICEIGVDLKGAFIEGKLFLSESDEVDFSLLDGLHFCVYGAENYLEDLFDSNRDSLKDLDEALFELDEFEICINIEYKDTPPISEIVRACSLLKSIGTHILPVMEDDLCSVTDSDAYDSEV